MALDDRDCDSAGQMTNSPGIVILWPCQEAIAGGESKRAGKGQRRRPPRTRVARAEAAAASAQYQVVPDQAGPAEPDLFDSDEFLVLPPYPQAAKEDPDLPF